MSENNNNFDDLKQLLKLKRHEIPPPGYFNRFSDDVVSRIRAGETGGSPSVLDQFANGTFWANLMQVFHGRPGVIGGFATSLCLLLLFGVVMADGPDGAPVAKGDGSAPSVPSGQELASVGGLLPAGEDSGIAISSNAVHSLTAMPALFGSQQNPLFQQAGFMQPAQ